MSATGKQTSLQLSVRVVCDGADLSQAAAGWMNARRSLTFILHLL